MKKLLFLLLIVSVFLLDKAFAQNPVVIGEEKKPMEININESVVDISADIIKLPPVSIKGGMDIMSAFHNRKATREYGSRQLALETLSELLWSTTGVNRKDGRRTNPTARNVQEIDVYVAFRDGGTYFYDYLNHTLNKISDNNCYKELALSQDFALKSPLNIIIVGDLSKFGDGDPKRNQNLAYIDGGIVSQNISLYCAATNLGTVARATMDAQKIKDILKLKDNHVLLLNHPVGELLK